MRPGPVVRTLLWPLSKMFEEIVRVRAWLYAAGILKQKRLNGVVISVGNLTVGGTGKTPMVLWIAQNLHDQRKTVGILSRGYKGMVRTDLSPSTLRDLAAQAPSRILGDEPQLLASRLGGKARIGVGAERYAHGLALEKLGVQWFVLDDGFQHLQLARDVDIVLLDGMDPFGGGHLLPSGRLREPKSALARADIVVITRTSCAPSIEQEVRAHTAAPVFYASAELEEVRPVEKSLQEAAPNAWLGRKVFAFCGIGNSAAFYRDVGRWGMEVAGQMAFADHHRYTQKDADRIESEAFAVGAEALLCTQKDTYNLQGAFFRQLPLYACHISMRVQDAATFWEKVAEILENKRAGRPR